MTEIRDTKNSHAKQELAHAFAWMVVEIAIKVDDVAELLDWFRRSFRSYFGFQRNRSRS